MGNRIATSRLARGVALVLALTACGPRGAAAQSGGVYDLTWNKVAGGGATSSTGGIYSLGETRAQPDAGTLAGGAYQLDGGFWMGVAMTQLAGAPGPDAAPPAVLALRGLARNPSVLPRLDVAFSLAGDAPAELALLDLAGRRVCALDVGRFGPGPHVVGLAPAPGVRPGIYWLRLRQGNAQRVAKAVVLR